MQNKKILLEALKPSWIISVASITLALLLIVGTAVLTRFESSELSQQVFAVQAREQVQSNDGAFDSITNAMTQNSFLNSLPLMLVWAGVGFGIYFLAVSAARVFGHAYAIKDQLEYVHVSRTAVMRQELTRLTIRLAAITALVVLLWAGLKIVVPYVLAVAYISAGTIDVLGVAYSLLGAAVLYVYVWSVAIAVRFIALRPRLFG